MASGYMASKPYRELIAKISGRTSFPPYRCFRIVLVELIGVDGERSEVMLLRRVISQSVNFHHSLTLGTPPSLHEIRTGDLQDVGDHIRLLISSMYSAWSRQSRQ